MTNNLMIAFPTIDALMIDDNASAMMRTLLIDPDAELLTDHYPLRTRLMRDDMIAAINALDTDARSILLLSFSLCPMHAIDYAICFDDDDPDCAAIRTCFPSHDT